MALGEITWMQWAEHLLSFAGLVAILAFGGRWIKKMTTHTKDMEQLDKVVRDTLREALDGVNEVRKIDKELFDQTLEKVNVELEVRVTKINDGFTPVFDQII